MIGISGARALRRPGASTSSIWSTVQSTSWSTTQGSTPSAAIEEMTSAEWAEVFAVNVDATFVCLQAAGRSMAQRSQGAIVNVASLSALRPTVRQSHYNSSNAAVIAL